MYGTYRECFDDNGVAYSSEAEMARAHGVLPSTFNKRKLDGAPLSVCLKPYKSPFNNGKDYFVYKEKRYKSLRACCMELEISYSAVANRIRREYCSPAEAIKSVLEKKSKNTLG
ncbi:MAG: hypothetical protein E7231_01500 [Cellulosilyticum sp.]|nr:hypothetical protein [Cellulosilyticum sp.]